jgi:hypothetical protein
MLVLASDEDLLSVSLGQSVSMLGVRSLQVSD